MSEPTLLQAFPELQLAVAHELGWPGDVSALGGAEQAQVKRLVDAGYRRFLYPPPVGQDQSVHNWSFLSPRASMTLWTTLTATADGAPDYDGDEEVSLVTITAAGFYASMVGHDLVFTLTANAYKIVEYVSATEVNVAGDASGEGGADTVTVTADGTYRMPDDFGALSGDFIAVMSDALVRRLPRLGLGQVVERRERNTGAGNPQSFALAPVSGGGASSSRQDLLFDSALSGVMTAEFTYQVLPNAMSSSLPYPQGVEAFSEALKLACLAVVDEYLHVDNGHHAVFMQQLTAAVLRDRQASAAGTLGYCGDASVRRNAEYDRTLGASITLFGVPA